MIIENGISKRAQILLTSELSPQLNTSPESVSQVRESERERENQIEQR